MNLATSTLLSLHNTFLRAPIGKGDLVLGASALVLVGAAFFNTAIMLTLVTVIVGWGGYRHLLANAESLSARLNARDEEVQQLKAQMRQQQLGYHAVCQLLTVAERQLDAATDLANKSVFNLTNEFSALHSSMDASIALAQSSVSELASGDNTFIHQSQQQLNLVVEQLESSMATKKVLVAANENVAQAALQLKHQTESIQRISKEITLLSLNASIEAARAGEAGRGFAVVAERVRELSDTTASAAAEIIERMTNLSAAVDSSSATLTQSTQSDEEVMRAARHNIATVLGGFSTITDNLNQTLLAMDGNTSMAKAQIGQAITDFQFQDRVSQKVGHVCNTLSQLARVCDTEAPVNPEQITIIEQQLFHSYTMEEERQRHKPNGVVAASAPDEVTFF